MLGGSESREWLEAPTSEGHTRMDYVGIQDQTFGCHTGPHAGLNIVNPQAGCEYMWLRNPEAARDTAEMMSSRFEIASLDGEIVSLDDPEYAAYTKMFDKQSPIDSQTIYRELCLVRIPADKLQAKRDAEAEVSRQAIQPGGEAYVQQATTAELQAGEGQATRFRRRDHGTQVREGGHDGAPVLESWTPDEGIVRVEN